MNIEKEHEVASALEDALNGLQRIANEYFLGRRVRFTNPTFNGQIYGKSKRSLRGREAIITSVFLDERFGVTFHSHDPSPIHAGFTLADIEFIEE